MKSKDLRLLAVAERQTVRDSLDLDDATRAIYPNDHRWDYILSVSRDDQLVGVEPHTASDSELKVVISKKQRAIAFLRKHLPPYMRVARWIWVTHGRVGFTIMERARRLLDQNGIVFAGRQIRKL